MYYMSMLQYYFEDRRDEFTEQIKRYDTQHIVMEFKIANTIFV